MIKTFPTPNLEKEGNSILDRIFIYLTRIKLLDGSKVVLTKKLLKEKKEAYKKSSSFPYETKTTYTTCTHEYVPCSRLSFLKRTKRCNMISFVI